MGSGSAREHQGRRRRGHHDECRGASGAHRASRAGPGTAGDVGPVGRRSRGERRRREEDAGRGRRDARPGVEARPVPTNSSNSVGSATPGSIIPRPSTSRPRPCITASASTRPRSTRGARTHPPEAHAFDNTPVATQFVRRWASGGVPTNGAVPPRGRDVRATRWRAQGQGDSFTPASDDGVYHDLGGKGGQTRRADDPRAAVAMDWYRRC